MNQGLIALSNSDYAAAEQAFGKSAGVEELNEALGVFYMKKGDYNAAVKALAMLNRTTPLWLKSW